MADINREYVIFVPAYAPEPTGRIINADSIAQALQEAKRVMLYVSDIAVMPRFSYVWQYDEYMQRIRRADAAAYHNQYSSLRVAKNER